MIIFIAIFIAGYLILGLLCILMLASARMNAGQIAADNMENGVGHTQESEATALIVACSQISNAENDVIAGLGTPARFARCKRRIGTVRTHRMRDRFKIRVE